MRDTIAEYQRLLTANETRAHLSQSIELAQQVAGIKITASHRDGCSVRRLAGATWITDAGLSELKEVARHCLPAAEGVTFAPNQVMLMARDATLTATVLKSVSWLAAREFVTSSKASFLLDAGLLVFHQAFHALLPLLEKTSASSLRLPLLASFVDFAETLTEPADRSHLLALCREAQGDVEAASKHHGEAVRATPADAHNFVTLLQVHWDYLTERGRFWDALEILLEAYPRVCRNDLDEVTELIRATFRMISPARNGSDAKRGNTAKIIST